MTREGWTYKKLGEIATFINGYPFKPSDWKDRGRKIIRIQNLNNPNAVYNYYDGDIDDRYIVSNGDVLISWSGSLGIFEWSDKEAILNQHIFKVVFNKGEINKRLFEYVVASRINEMKTKVHGITMQHITKKDFDKISIPVPPLSEQQRIVNELDLLSGIIEKKKEQLKEYDQLAQSIFYDMFGDPIDNPKGWEVKKLGEVCNSELGKTLNQSKDTGTLRPYLCAINIQWNKIIKDNLKQTRFEDVELERYSVKKGDLLICEGGDIGRAAIWNEDEEIQYQNALHRLRFSKEMIPIFCLYDLKYLKDKGVLDNRYGKGVTIKHLVKSALLSIPFILPPLSLQQSFASKIEAIERQKELIRQSIAETETLFNSRMDYYFN